jgi:hypothetical protein
MERFNLFEVYGVELEYMLVDANTLAVRPIADQLLAQLAGHRTSDVQRGDATWSNELAAHVIELKTTNPTPTLDALPAVFSAAIDDLQPALNQLGLRLLPTAMHPWMDPTSETELWPHENAAIYQAFHRIFDCHTHGWANVQSVHLNLPFADDAQFARLHAAVRLILPLLPALAASSPIVQRQVGHDLDSRLVHYIGHCRRVPSLTGNVIPEPVYDEPTYREEIFGPIEADITPLDTDEVMDVEFLNARGAIARFDRGSIEIRLMDVQEYPAADVAICAAVVGVLQMLVEEEWSEHHDQREISSQTLRAMLDLTVQDAEQAVFNDAEFLRHFGVSGAAMNAGELWSVLIQRMRRTHPITGTLDQPLRFLLANGTLSRRIGLALGNPSEGETIEVDQLRELYQTISRCLVQGVPFQP